MKDREQNKSMPELHLDWVERLKQRGEKIVEPAENAMGSIYGYDKTKGLKSAGTIFRTRDGVFELLQDVNLKGYVVEWGDLGLCDAKCWYEALDAEYQENIERIMKRRDSDERLTQLVIHGIKELGEIAEVLIKKDRPDHWVNELGDLCGLVILPMLNLAGMDFTYAVELGLSRKRKKTQTGTKDIVNN